MSPNKADLLLISGHALNIFFLLLLWGLQSISLELLRYMSAGFISLMFITAIILTILYLVISYYGLMKEKLTKKTVIVSQISLFIVLILMVIYYV